jgi:hypothetical protein
LAALFCVALLLGCAFAEDSAAVPQLVKFSGTISGTPAGTVSVIFALYKDQTGGAPLWQEVQNLAVDAAGHYTSLLGARSATGIPVEVFSTGEARWLGVQAERQPEQPRVLLVSVPYALKASDAETLGGLPASAFLRASAAPGAVAAPANYINTAAVNAAARSAVAAAIAVNNPTLGYVPYFYDASGDLQNSSIFQATTGNVGIGTTNPAAMFTLVGTNPSIRLENYSNTPGDSPNFNFYTGRGTPTAPLPTQGGDNLGQFASAGYNGAAFPGSKVKVTFLSTENWTASANGTAMTFATTLNGTTSRAERMRIDNTGNVGIGTTTPAYPLSVNGTIQSATGGFKFPDGTTQTTAAAGGAAGVTLTSPDTSITVGGTAIAPTVKVNTTLIQQRVSSTCSSGSAIASISSTGTVGCQTVSGGGAISLPVNWTSAATAPKGVLNVTNTATGPASPQQTYPTAAFFSTVPSAIVATSTGTGVTSGVTGQATGTSGVGVVGFTTTSVNPAVVAFSGITGYTPADNGSSPQAIFAEMTNGNGGTVINAAASASTAPVCVQGSKCEETRIIVAQGSATSGEITAFSADLASPSATGIQLNFEVPPTSGSFISTNVNCSPTAACPSFNVDGNANISTSGTLIVQGLAQVNNGLTVSNGPLTVNGGMVFNGKISSEFGGPIFVQGDLNVSGNFSKGSGSFKIDHPLDPANKYLYHSFVESPDMMNIYNGLVILDKHGKAVVQLPDYFQALNQDFRYQLTAIGTPGPKLYVASEIAGNQFAIAGGKPGAKVSWQVTGIRHDAYADAHRIQVEEDKGKERGTYLHPELFQQSPVVARK